MRSSSLATTIFHENSPINESTSNANHNQQIDKHSSIVPLDKLVFTTTSTTNSKASYWTVTDRQPEWYKLSIPIHQSILNSKHEIVPFKRLIKVPEKKKVNSNKNDRIDRPT
jgi:predicted double-glycine peptidase